MPFFFIISGVVYGIRVDSGRDLSLNVIAKTKSLLLPYLIWGTLYQLFVSVLSIIGGSPAEDTLKMRLRLVVTLQSGVMWFLPAMYIATILFHLNWKHKALATAMGIAALAAAVFIPHSSDIAEALLRSFTGLFFIGVGFWGHAILTKPVHPCLTIAICICNILLMPYGGSIGMSERTFGTFPLLVIIKAVMGSYAAIQLAMIIEKQLVYRRPLLIWGERSIVILCLHPFIIQVFRLTDHFLFNDVVSTWGLTEGIILTTITMILITIFMPINLELLGWTWGWTRK